MARPQGYPYARDTALRGSGHSPMFQAAGSAGPQMNASESFSHASGGSQTFRKAYEAMQRTLASIKGAKNLWEFAVKRNSLPTSLILLSSVLVVDALMVDQSQLKHFSFRAQLAAQDGHSLQQPQQSQQQQQGREREPEQKHIPPHSLSGAAAAH